VEDTPKQTVLDFIEDVITTHQTKYIVLSFQDELSGSDRKKTVEMIKKHFDIFIILKSDMPNHKQLIEEYFSYGVHGLYFASDINLCSKQHLEILTFAVDLFVRGWVFANTANDKELIKKLLAMKIIPVPVKYDARLSSYIKSHKCYNKFSSNMLKVIPLLDRGQADYSLTDKIKLKTLLETMNLRQKLRVKNIDESFGSSGL